MDRQPVSPSTQLQREISNSESRPANISPPSSSPHSLKRKRTPISEEPPVTADFIPLDFGDASEEGEAIEKTPNNSISRAPAPSNTTPSPSPSSLSSPSSPENAEPNMGSADGETSSKDQSKKRTRRKKSKSESEAKVSKKAARKDASESAESQTKITPQITDKSNANSDREAGEITDSESESERIDAAARRRTEARLKAVPVLRKQPPPPESSSDESDVSKSALRSSAPKDGTSRAPSPEKTEQEIRNATRRALKKERRRVRRKLERDNRRAKAAAEHPKGGTFSNMPEASDESEGESEEEYQPPESIAPSPKPSKAPKSPKASGKKDEFLEHRYYTAYAMPDLYAEEERPMFANTRPNIRSEVIKASKPPPAAPATNVCSICVKPGHSTPSCPALTCTHCSAHGTHFSHACPTLSPRSPPELDWRAIPSHRLTPLTSPPLPPLRATCYNCGATGHYGDDCPLVRPPDDGYGSFSLRDIAARGYAPRDELEDLEEHKELISNADGRRNHMRYAEAAEAGELGMPYDPYAAHKLTPALPAPPPTHESKGYSGGGGMSRSNGYRGPPERRDGGGGGRGGSRYGDSRRGGGGGGGGGGRGGGGGGGSRRGGGDAYRPSGYAGRGAWNQFNR